MPVITQIRVIPGATSGTVPPTTEFSPQLGDGRMYANTAAHRLVQLDRERVERRRTGEDVLVERVTSNLEAAWSRRGATVISRGVGAAQLLLGWCVLCCGTVAPASAAEVHGAVPGRQPVRWSIRDRPGAAVRADLQIRALGPRFGHRAERATRAQLFPLCAVGSWGYWVCSAPTLIAVITLLRA
jgi:hypothetical protein